MNGPDPLSLDEVLQRGLVDGVITDAQADSLRKYVADAVPVQVSGRSMVVEAIGYLGGAIALAGALLVGATFWGDLATTGRCVVLVAGTLVPLAAGGAVPAGSPGVGARLRSVLWLVSVGAFAGLLAVFGERELGLEGRGLLLLVAAGCAAYAAVLWAAHRTPLQQVALMVTIAVTAAAALRWGSEAADLPGLGVWGSGLLWIVLGRANLLVPARLALVSGSVMMILGAMLTAGSDAGMVLVLVTVVGVVIGSLVLRDLVLLAVGALGAVVNLPGAMTRWFPDSVAAAVGLVVLGLLLVVAAAFIAVRRNPAQHARQTVGRTNYRRVHGSDDRDHHARRRGRRVPDG